MEEKKMEIVDVRTGELIPLIVEDAEGNLTVSKEACDLIVFAEETKKQMENAYKEYKTRLREAMEFYGIKKIDAPKFVSTYKDGFFRSGGVDKDLLEGKYPDIYKEVKKEDTWVEPSVAVRMRKPKE